MENLSIKAGVFLNPQEIDISSIPFAATGIDKTSQKLLSLIAEKVLEAEDPTSFTNVSRLPSLFPEFQNILTPNILATAVGLALMKGVASKLNMFNRTLTASAKDSGAFTIYRGSTLAGESAISYTLSSAGAGTEPGKPMQLSSPEEEVWEYKEPIEKVRPAVYFDSLAILMQQILYPMINIRDGKGNKASFARVILDNYLEGENRPFQLLSMVSSGELLLTKGLVNLANR